MSCGLSDPLDVGEPLDDKFVGVDGAEYGKISASASEEESWATALFKDVLVLWVVLTEVQTHAKTTNLLLNKELSKRI